MDITCSTVQPREDATQEVALPHRTLRSPLRLSQLDPWLPVDTTVQPPTDQSFTPSFGRMPPMWFPRPTKNPVDFTDAAFLARYSSDITPMVRYFA